MGKSGTGETARVDQLKSHHQMPALLDSKQAARLLNVSERTVTRLCIRGKIRARRVGRLWRINRDALLSSVGLTDEA